MFRFLNTVLIVIIKNNNKNFVFEIAVYFSVLFTVSKNRFESIHYRIETFKETEKNTFFNGGTFHEHELSQPPYEHTLSFHLRNVC